MMFLITGGCGFIGSEVIRYIIENTDHSVINIDKLTYASNPSIANKYKENKKFFFEKIDICNEKDINRIFNSYDIDIVMHLAAESHVDRSIKSPVTFIESNILGTYVLLEESRKYWMKLKGVKKSNFRFHHISTDEVFGDLINDQNTLFTEETSYNPSSPYSASKASSDHLVRAWNRTYELPTVITNCSNNYGPYQYPEKLIPLTILNAINNKTIPVYGDGSQIRDWLYVEDHVKALLLCSLNSMPGETYNIGGFNEITNLEVVNKICNILDELLPKDSTYSDQISFVRDRPGHDQRYAIDASKIKNEFNWEPIETFETGIRKTVKWYLENQDWCNSTLNEIK